MTDITKTSIPPRTCTIGPNAVDGKRCGKPAVAWFISGGRVYAECAEHLTPGKLAGR